MKHLEEKLNMLAASFNGSASIHIDSEEWEIAIDSNRLMKSASLIKLAILLEGFRQIESGDIHLQQLIRIMPEAVTGGAGILSSLSPQREYSLQELLTLMIAVSDNTATNVLIDLLSMKRINKFCVNLGCRKTFLQRKMMDFSSSHENLISAYDTVTLLKHLMNSSYSKNMLDMLQAQQFRHKLPALMNPQLSVANKTGELCGVEHDAAIIMKKGGKPVYAAVLLTDFTHPDEALLLQRKIGKFLSHSLMNNLSSE